MRLIRPDKASISRVTFWNTMEAIVEQSHSCETVADDEVLIIISGEKLPDVAIDNRSSIFTKTCSPFADFVKSIRASGSIYNYKMIIILSSIIVY